MEQPLVCCICKKDFGGTAMGEHLLAQRAFFKEDEIPQLLCDDCWEILRAGAGIDVLIPRRKKEHTRGRKQCQN